MNSCEFTFSVTALANALADRLSEEDLELAAAVFSQLGDTLSTISTLRSRCSNQSGKKTEGEE